MRFERYVGVDYSGAATADKPLPGLRACAATRRTIGEAAPAESSGPRRRNWTRRRLAGWLLEQVRGDAPCLVGIDHGFSFPRGYLDRHRLGSWDQFLDDFCEHWPTDEPEATVAAVRQTARAGRRSGGATDYRLTERWTSSAKSVFLFGVTGSVATSTHAGLPWLRWLRREAAGRLHFWPFDGWRPPAGRSVVAEVYPSLFRNRYPNDGRTNDQQDAYAVARWLQEADRRGSLPRYFDPPLSPAERRTARREGWILGVA